MKIYFLFFFFFQAEDGIRDLTVTGVQTCALPIWCLIAHARGKRRRDRGDADGTRRPFRRDGDADGSASQVENQPADPRDGLRADERRPFADVASATGGQPRVLPLIDGTSSRGSVGSFG